jgi:hypothetical protein
MNRQGCIFEKTGLLCYGIGYKLKHSSYRRENDAVGQKSADSGKFLESDEIEDSGGFLVHCRGFAEALLSRNGAEPLQEPQMKNFAASGGVFNPLENNEPTGGWKFGSILSIDLLNRSTRLLPVVSEVA